MKHKIYLLLFICLNCLTAKSQNLFEADYPLFGNDNKSLICYDHSFFRTLLLPAGGIVNVMKTDSAGNVLWSNDITYPNSTFFSLTDIVQAADSGFLILLNWRLTSGSHSDPTVTKLDKNGNHEWTRTYISVLSAYGNGIIKNNDNGFIVVGARQLVDFVMKCDATGAITWIKQFNGTTPANNYDIATQDYNRFVVRGSHGHLITFFQIDLSGNLYWHTATTLGSYGGQCWSLKPLSNGGYISAGFTNYTGNFSYDALLIKADSTGAVQWLKIYEANQGGGCDIAELPDSSLLFVGSQQLNSLVLKTDKDGNLQFAKTETAQGSYDRVNLYSPGSVMISGHLNYPLFALADTACSSLCNIIPFTIQEYTPAYADTLLFFNPVALPFADTIAQIVYTSHPLIRNVLCGFNSANELTFQNEISIYPNPVTDKLTIEINNNEPSEIILYDIAAQKLLQEKFANTLSLNTAQLSKGIYFYEVRNKNGVLKKGKVVKE